MNNINFTPFPTLETERLILRPINISDDKEIFFMRSDKEMNKYIARDLGKDISEAHAFIEKMNNFIANNISILWAIQLKGDSTLIGTICLWNFTEDKYIGEVGYDLMPDFQGKGIMDETMKAVTNYGFNSLQLRAIEAYTQKGNILSRKLLDNNHFTWHKERKDEGFPLNLIYVLNTFH
ncbi:MAG: ribosomal-protein-alanine N-acetyltransferase [Maribacter sp.]|jgi:ribosomal-protein-alanine N-acetyltransferase